MAPPAHGSTVLLPGGHTRHPIGPSPGAALEALTRLTDSRRLTVTIPGRPALSLVGQEAATAPQEPRVSPQARQAQNSLAALPAPPGSSLSLPDARKSQAVAAVRNDEQVRPGVQG